MTCLVCTDNHQSIVRTHVKNIRNAIGGNIVNTYTHTHRNRRHASSFESCCIISCLIILKEKLPRDYGMCQSLHQQNEGILTMTGGHKRWTGECLRGIFLKDWHFSHLFCSYYIFICMGLCISARWMCAVNGRVCSTWIVCFVFRNGVVHPVCFSWEWD